MRGIRKIASLVLVLCLVSASSALMRPELSYAASGATANPPVQAASATKSKKSKKVFLSLKKITLKQGKTRALWAKNATTKVKWSTTNKKIAYVQKTGGKYQHKAVIKAGNKAGTCYIKAQVGKKTYKCKVTVKKAASQGSPVIVNPPVEEIQVETRQLSDSSKNLSAGLTAVPPSNAEPSADFIASYTGFSLELLKKTIAADRAAGSTSNLLVSPDSVTTAFAMVENGAAGETLSEMESVLSPGVTADDFNRYLSTVNRRLMSSDAFIYNVSNSIWAREGLVDVREDFLQTNMDYHDAEFYVAPFDGQTVQDINSWVYNKSRNMIDGILNDLSEDARMVVLNTVAFEGKWDHEFSSANTAQRDFTAFDGTKKKVPMMFDRDSYHYLEMKGGKGFVKYYKAGSPNSGVAFMGILPPSDMSADDYISSLSASDFASAWSNKKAKDVILRLPKFDYDYSVEMGDLLQEMGIRTAFTNLADFTRMADPTPDSPGLNISKVLHKTHIDLDENGTRAAAATAIVMEKSTAYPGEAPIELNFDRPFVYALVDTATGIPLFIGEVVQL